MSKIKKASRHGSLQFAVNMTLFAIFALFLTLVLLTGASSFRQVSAVTEERFSERSALLYIAQKTRAYDRTDAVAIREYEGVQTLVLTERLPEEAVNIYIYRHNGFLKELVRFGDDEPNLSLGTELFEIEEAGFEKVQPNLLKITIDGSVIFVKLSAGGTE